MFYADVKHKRNKMEEGRHGKPQHVERRRQMWLRQQVCSNLWKKLKAQESCMETYLSTSKTVFRVSNFILTASHEDVLKCYCNYLQIKTVGICNLNVHKG